MNDDTLHAAIDTETTGLDTQNDRIRSISAVIGTKTYGIVHKLCIILDGAGQPSAPEALTIHKIPDIVPGMMSQRKGLQLLASMTRDTKVIMHHKAFDAPMLLNSYSREQIPPPEFLQNLNSIIDTMDIGKKFYPGRQTNLENLCRIAGICSSLLKARAERHDSLDDAIMCFELWRCHQDRKTFDLEMGKPNPVSNSISPITQDAAAGMDWLT